MVSDMTKLGHTQNEHMQISIVGDGQSVQRLRVILNSRMTGKTHRDVEDIAPPKTQKDMYVCSMRPKKGHWLFLVSWECACLSV